VGSVFITLVLAGIVFAALGFTPWFLRRMLAVYGALQIQRAEQRLRLAEVRKAEAEADLARQDALNAQLKKLP
jgi:cell division protein FtsB